MRVSLKILGILWVGLLLIIGGLLFNAYSKLRPDTFIALLTEQVQKNYPGSKLTVGKINYRFSLDFNLNLQNIHLRRSDRLLASIGEVELKVPWWLLLANHGNAQINLKNLDIYVDHESVKDVSAPVEAAPESETIKVTLPSYLSEANFTLRAKQISIRDINSARRYFVVSKLLVREFQYGKNSAFELNIPVLIKHKNANYTSNLWLFGDVTPETSSWKLNYRGEFRTKESNDKFQMEDLVIGGQSVFVPSSLKVTSEFKLEIEKKTVGTGEFSADQENLEFDLKLTSLPLNYFGFIYEEIKNPYLVNPDGVAAGSLKFKRAFETPQATLTGKLNFDGRLVLSAKDFIQGRWLISFEDSKWEVSFISPKGEASFFRRSIIDLKTNNVVQYVEELGFTGLDLSITLAPVVPFHKFYTELYPAYFSSVISYKNCLLGDQVLDGQFKYGFLTDQKYYQAEMKDEKSSFVLNYSSKKSNAVDVKIRSFKWNPAFQFLSPVFTASQGILDGKIEGRWVDNWETGDWLVQMSGSNFTDTQGKLPEFISQTANFFGLVSNNFPKQNLNLTGKNGNLTMNSLMLENTESAKITGALSSKHKSFLTLSYPKNRKIKSQKKEVIEPYWKQKEEI